MDDQAFWDLHVDSSRCATIESNGVNNLVAVLGVLPAALAGRVIAVADTDFRDFTNTNLFAAVAKDVLFYDEGFLETFLLGSAAFTKILKKFGSPSKIAAFEAGPPNRVVLSYLQELASAFGRVRVASLLNGWYLPIDKFSPYKYVSSATWGLNLSALHQDIVVAVNSHKVAGVADIVEADVAVACGAIVSTGPFSLVHGHDALKLLDIGLAQVIGDKCPGANHICDHLCTGFESASLSAKVAVKDLRQWSEKNGYKVM